MDSEARRVVTASTADLGGAEVVLTLGPQHPSAHGVLRLALELDGDIVVRAEPLVGLLHRGAEKLFEVRDYRQILVLANRHDWLSAFSSELGVVLAVETMLGMEVPERAVWARTALAELNRVLSHLAFLGGFPPGADPLDPTGTSARSLALRDPVQQVMEEATGGRLHFMANQVGGLKADLPDGWTDRARAAASDVRAGLPELTGAVLAAAQPLAGVGVASPEQVAQYGLSGPVARASGVPLDLRRDEPYLAYGALAQSGALRVVTRTAGDCPARLEVLAEQVSVSLDCVAACLDVLDALPPGPVNLKLPKVLRAPEGERYAWTEGPSGINGCYLVSRGEKTPWRLKLRTASFNNVQVLSEVLPGVGLAELTGVLASLFYVVGDVDK
ncbi:MAG TPA: NADH-quinone oxidoreductase subunit D [Actinomycetes bacterium]